MSHHRRRGPANDRGRDATPGSGARGHGPRSYGTAEGGSGRDTGAAASSHAAPAQHARTAAPPDAWRPDPAEPAVRRPVHAPERPVRTGYHRVVDYPRTGRRGPRRYLPSFRLLLSCFLVTFFLLFGVVSYAYVTAPTPDAADVLLPQAASYQYANGQAITQLGTNRHDVPIGDVPPVVRDAVLSAEDRGFYHEAGVSPTGILRAFYNDLTSSGGSLQGGSTITQQFVKNAYLTQAQTFSRKFREIFIAIKVARKYSKDQILDDYLNTTYFGRSAYGIDAAAQAYFGVDDVRQITDPARAAYLAALIQQPNGFAMASDPSVSASTRRLWTSGLRARWSYVLDGMASQRWITPAQRAAAVFPQPPPQRPFGSLAGLNGYMVQAADDYLDLAHRGDDPTTPPSSAQVRQDGDTVVTTFDPTLMADARDAVHQRLLDAPNLRGADTSGLTASLAAVDPDSGAVRAFYTGDDYATAPNDDLLYGTEQPGSTFKAFTLAAALEQGISPQSQFDGSTGYQPAQPNGQPYLVTDPSTGQQVPYTVPNEDGFNPGMVNLDYAAQESVNTAFVRLEMRIGFQAIMNVLKAVGIAGHSEGLSATPALTLGTASVTPMRMAAAYATFAADGVYHEPYVVREVLSSDGRLLWQHHAAGSVAMPSNVAAGVTDTLGYVTRYGTGSRAPQISGLTNIVGKTGTTDDNLTAWFDGYSRRLAVAVGMWREVPELGANGRQRVDQDGRKQVTLTALDSVNGGTRVNGADYPTEIWGQFMRQASQVIPDIDPPFTPFDPAGLTVLNPAPAPTSTATATGVPATAPATPYGTGEPAGGTRPATSQPTAADTAPGAATPSAAPSAGAEQPCLLCAPGG
jgi:membrane peptidoglycan carboxypeptidase